MPVLLTREEDFDGWLNGAPHLAFALAREYPPDQMRIVQEGFKKQDILYRCSVNPGRLIAWRPWLREQAVPSVCMAGAYTYGSKFMHIGFLIPRAVLESFGQDKGGDLVPSRFGRVDLDADI